MTVLEAIQANPVFSSIPEKDIKSMLGLRSVDGTVTYTEDSLKDVELVTADLYVDIALLPKFKEGQLALEYNPELLIKRAKNLYLKHCDSRADEFEPKPVNVGISSEDV